jgi:starch-binding outer membrane protein, SusD/RagB family
MKRIYYWIFSAAVVMSVASCKKDFLSIAPLDKYSDEQVWKDPALAQTFVNNIYLGLPHGFSNIMMSSLVDETTYNADFGSSNVTKSQLTPSDIGIFDQGYWTGNRQRGVEWRAVYKFVRAANLFFEKIEGATFSEAEKNSMKGEVFFLRAYLYHNLVSMYGGVPIIKKTFGLTDDFNVPRDSYENCVKFMVSDIEEAVKLLPETQTGVNKGRATKGAALALKSRVLLQAASDLYNNNGAWAGGYANKELIGYVGGDRTARWQAARDAAKAVINLNLYNLYKPAPTNGVEATKNYADIFLLKETSEDIFIRYFTAKISEDWDGYNPGLYNNPNGWHGWGSNTPIGQHVDAYEMADGSKFSWNNPVHKTKPYENRDPRFYASINYDGAKWRPRPSDAAGRDPVGIVQTGYYEKPDGTVIPGLDTRNSPLEDWNGTYTGYYMRKFIDPSINAQYDKQEQPWRYIRYTEILLNYAEASLALGDETEAKKYINMIRKRAGMPDITETGAALVERYRNERRIELAFEDQRFNDVRRWMIAPEAYQNAAGVSIRYKVDASGTNILSGPTYTVMNAQDRAWNPRFYFMPIKLDEMNRNKNLVQNPLY